MKKLITTALLLTTSILGANEVGLNIGSANMNYDKPNPNIILGTNPDKSFRNYELFTTLEGKLPMKLKTYLSYTQNTNDTLRNQFVLVGANKEYGDGKGKLYAGLVAGFGELKWKINPLTSTSSDKTANSFIAGVQVGGKYDVSNKLFINLNGKYLKHNYGTDINTQTTIEHKTTTSIALGVGYKF
ncbi:MAG: hypothetical protein PHF17_05500 [Arcobacteraceae bacterium]|nr:hypothetical protein [Arcobacteraceae bacterium]